VDGAGGVEGTLAAAERKSLKKRPRPAPPPRSSGNVSGTVTA
jgi:hypothetical protein